MRFAALIPVLLCTAALVLSFLCLFAGSSRHFMQDYAILTLNTSRIGENLLNASHHSSNPFLSILDNITDSIESELNHDANSIAHALGLRDWYSAHLLDYCEGYYEPSAIVNASIPQSSIHENTTYCSNKTVLYHFDPQTTLQQQLNASQHPDIHLDDLHWPHEISTGLDALRIAQRAVFVLYCIGIGLVFSALMMSVIALFLDGRGSAFCNVVVDWLAFVAIGLASAIVSAIMVKAVDLINHYGNDVGVSAEKGHKFLVLTWVATAIMFVTCLLWCCECVIGRKRGKPHRREPKDA